MADISQIRLPSGDTFDLIDEKSGYITAQYIENKTDYSIPVSRVGEIVVGETAIGTDSTNFPTSKAVVDYVDERVVQEIDAIDVGVTSVNGKTGSITLSASDVGAADSGWAQDIDVSVNDLYNRNFVTGPSSSVNSHVATFNGTTGNTIQDSGYTIAKSVPSSAVFTDQRVESQVISASSSFKGNYPILLHTKAKLSDVYTDSAYKMATFYFHYGYTGSDVPYLKVQNATLASEYLSLSKNSGMIYSTRIQIDSTLNSSITLTLPKETGTIALTSDIPTIPTNISSFTNDSGYLTASDIASVMSYKGTKANYAALPSTGNTTGDVWHLTDTGAEWAWDGSAWQELGTAIDVSSFLTSETDPVFTASPAHGIAASDITNWNAKATISIVRW